MTRLRSDFWVSAYIRQCAVAGLEALLVRRGAPEAGAIFIDLDFLDGRHVLFSPASQSEATTDGDRRWARAHKEDYLVGEAVKIRIAREIQFDADLWLVTLESRSGIHLLDVISVA